ncbi:MAG: hypothetical protein FWF83_05830 [Clostridiales bacterium]|nr:hypothetical protein [Clostridiales bacterium]
MCKGESEYKEGLEKGALIVTGQGGGSRWRLLAFLSLGAGLAMLLAFACAYAGVGPAKAAFALPGEARAEVWAKDLSISASPGINGVALLDSNTSTKQKLPSGTSVTITSREEQMFYGLYLLWDKPPGQWTLHAENEDLSWDALCGGHGFIHEYIPLSKGACSLSVNIIGDEAVLCDIFALGYGELPEWVQVWQPPLVRADMLLLSTHGDDEHLYFGGTMPYYAGELGLKVQVSYLTNHWAEPYRTHEVLNGLWAVGVAHYPVIGPYADQYADRLDAAKELYPVEEMTNYQIGLLRRFKPLVVVGHDLKGEYGHGVHMLNAQTLIDALEASADPSRDPASAEAYGLWDVPKAYLHLYPENKVIMNWDIPLARFDGATAFEMAQKGFSYHKSQQQWFSVRKTGVHDCTAFGLYRSFRGPDLMGGMDGGGGMGGDFMEGLAPYPDQPYPYGELTFPWISHHLSRLTPGRAGMDSDYRFLHLFNIYDTIGLWTIRFLRLHPLRV